MAGARDQSHGGGLEISDVLMWVWYMAYFHCCGVFLQRVMTREDLPWCNIQRVEYSIGFATAAASGFQGRPALSISTLQLPALLHPSTELRSGTCSGARSNNARVESLELIATSVLSEYRMAILAGGSASHD